MKPSQLGNRYDVGSRLGAGGMAAVYRGKDSRLLRDVAIKILDTSQDGSEDSLFYFHREARAVASLRHTNIVQIYDYSGPDERPAYIIMELIEGGNVDEIVLSRHPIPEAVIVAIAHAVCSALAHAHEHGVIHRDIKPANVMIERGGRVLLTDFGIAKAYKDPGKLGQTVAKARTELFGTPDFMAPEQILEQAVGPHTDVFALGSLIYCLSTNVSPFDHQDTVEVLRRVVDAEYRELRAHRPDLSAELGALVKSCLTKNPAARPTAEQVATALEDRLAALGVPSPARRIQQFLKGEAQADTERSKAPPPQPREPDPTTTVVDAQILAEMEPEPTAEKTEAGVAQGPSQDDTIIGTSPKNPGRAAASRGEAGSNDWSVTTNETAQPESFDSGATQAIDKAQIISNARRDRSGPPPALGQDMTEKGQAHRGKRLPLLVSAGVALVILVALAGWLVLRRPATPQVTTTRAEDTSSSQGSATVPVVATAIVPTAVSSTPALVVTTTPPTTTTSLAAAPRPEPAAQRNNEDDDEDDRRNPRQPRRSSRPTRKPDPPAAPSPPPPPVEEATGPAVVELKVKPWGAVFVDGTAKGNTPMVRELTLSPGKHTINVDHPSLGRLTKTVLLKPGERKLLTFEFGR